MLTAKQIVGIIILEQELGVSRHNRTLVTYLSLADKQKVKKLGQKGKGKKKVMSVETLKSGELVLRYPLLEQKKKAQEKAQKKAKKVKK